MATLMQGPPLAGRIRAEVADDVRELGELGLTTVQVGEDPASTIYLRRKHEAAREVGIASDDRKLPAEIAEDELLQVVAGLNADDAVDGILVQLPLPDHLD
jgi:methylenetetrahydrofolate dehydrogenase (NADP+) / methenyltetrahydrofolate cyclohydrolase